MSWGPDLWLGIWRYTSASDARSWREPAEELVWRATGLGIGAGTFHRIDPTGFASDVGAHVRAEGRLLLGPEVAVEVVGSFLVGTRALVTDATLLSIAPEGNRILMGRFEAGLDWRFATHWSLVMGAWMEHSDRDDPLQLGGLPVSAPRLAYGLDAGLMFAL